MGVRLLRGRYLVGGEPEEFACAPGPAGWRYTGARPGGQTIDLTLDARGRPYRLELAVGGWVLRGGGTGNSLLWVRRPADHPEQGAEHSAQAHGFFGDSPGFWVALSRLGQPQVRVVEVTGPALATRTVDLLVRTSPEDGATRYEATALDTGESRSAYLTGDLVVAGDGIELLDLAAE